MDGLSEKYSQAVDVRKLDVNSAEGNQVFKAYQLPGHPSVVLLNSQGQVLWKGFGEPALQELEQQIIAAQGT